jgi:hypothetical protein
VRPEVSLSLLILGFGGKAEGSRGEQRRDRLLSHSQSPRTMANGRCTCVKEREHQTVHKPDPRRSRWQVRPRGQRREISSSASFVVSDANTVQYSTAPHPIHGTAQMAGELVDRNYDESAIIPVNQINHSHQQLHSPCCNLALTLTVTSCHITCHIHNHES